MCSPVILLASISRSPILMDPKGKSIMSFMVSLWKVSSEQVLPSGLRTGKRNFNLAPLSIGYVLLQLLTFDCRHSFKPYSNLAFFRGHIAFARIPGLGKCHHFLIGKQQSHRFISDVKDVLLKV